MSPYLVSLDVESDKGSVKRATKGVKYAIEFVVREGDSLILIISRCARFFIDYVCSVQQDLCLKLTGGSNSVSGFLTIDAVLNRGFSQLERVLVGCWVEAARNLEKNVKNESVRITIDLRWKIDIFSLALEFYPLILLILNKI